MKLVQTIGNVTIARLVQSNGYKHYYWTNTGEPSYKTRYDGYSEHRPVADYWHAGGSTIDQCKNDAIETLSIWLDEKHQRLVHVQGGGL